MALSHSPSNVTVLRMKTHVNVSLPNDASLLWMTTGNEAIARPWILMLAEAARGFFDIGSYGPGGMILKAGNYVAFTRFGQNASYYAFEEAFVRMLCARRIGYTLRLSLTGSNANGGLAAEFTSASVCCISTGAYQLQTASLNGISGASLSTSTVDMKAVVSGENGVRKSVSLKRVTPSISGMSAVCNPYGGYDNLDGLLEEHTRLRGSYAQRYGNHAYVMTNVPLANTNVSGVNLLITSSYIDGNINTVRYIRTLQVGESATFTMRVTFQPHDLDVYLFGVEAYYGQQGPFQENSQTQVLAEFIPASHFQPQTFTFNGVCNAQWATANTGSNHTNDLSWIGVMFYIVSAPGLPYLPCDATADVTFITDGTDVMEGTQPVLFADGCYSGSRLSCQCTSSYMVHGPPVSNSGIQYASGQPQTLGKGWTSSEGGCTWILPQGDPDAKDEQVGWTD